MKIRSTLRNINIIQNLSWKHWPWDLFAARWIKANSTEDITKNQLLKDVQQNVLRHEMGENLQMVHVPVEKVFKKKHMSETQNQI